jgi:hypothetical protein
MALISDEEIAAMRERDNLDEFGEYYYTLSIRDRFALLWKMGMQKSYPIDGTLSADEIERELFEAVVSGADGVYFSGNPPDEMWVRAIKAGLHVSVHCEHEPLDAPPIDRTNGEIRQ